MEHPVSHNDKSRFGLRTTGTSLTLTASAVALLCLHGPATAATPQPSAQPDRAQADTIEELKVVGQPLDSILSSQDLARKQANDLDDMFSGISSVMVGGSVGAAQKIYVRNLGEDTLNIMVDGATQSGVTYHHTGRITVEPELLKQVDVQVGAGEATNGPGALGGAIRFETKDPGDLLDSGRHWGALLKSGYFSNTDGTKNSVTLYGRANDVLSAMASYVKSDQDNIEDGNGNTLAGTESEQALKFVKLVGDLGSDHTLSLSHEALTEEGEKLRRPEWAESASNPLRLYEFERETTTLNYAWTPADSDLWHFDANLYLTEFDIYRPFDNYASAVESTGFTLSNTSNLARHAVTYGIDYRDDEVTAGDASMAPEHTETSEVTGFFIQDHFQLTDTFLLSLGTRYDTYEVTDKLDNDFDDEGFSPNLGFSWELAPQLTFSGGYAEALRGVETNDGFKLFGTTNDPDLEAERARNAELGLEYVVDRFTFSAGVHDVTIENAIGNELPWSRHYENLGDIESDGYTLGVAYSGERLYANLSFLDTSAELNGEELTRYSYGYLGTTAGDTLSINLSYLLTDEWELGWIGQIVQDVNDIYVVSAEASIDKPGYQVHDFYINWNPYAFDNLNLTLTVKNAFDEQYLDHGSIEDFTHIPGYEAVVGQPAAGRDIRFTAALRF